MCSKKLVLIVVGLLLCAGLVSVNVQATSKDTVKIISSKLESLQILPATISNIKSPELKTPEWLRIQIEAQQAAELASRQATEQATRQQNATHSGTFTYDVTTRGSIIADFVEFESQANQTLNDARGWARLGVSFQEVDSGGDFTLVLSEAGQVPSFSSGCSVDWSCRVGRYIIINQDRWLYASDAWNQSGGSLRDYRHMVVNHETGHWLGHDHNFTGCSVTGQLAPLMEQQSIDLQGCSFNPWPLDSELWSSRI